MQESPYNIPTPAVVSFSGGRTSGYMLYHILQHYQFHLPKDLHVVFCNTGKEREETLEFAEKCSKEWQVPIHWLEFSLNGENKYKHVDFATASRNGQPFRDAIAFAKWVPNPMVRKCTIEMKIKTIERFCRSMGWKSWHDAIGIRYDEKHRQKTSCGVAIPYYPLIKARITENEVKAFWENHSFQLQLPWGESNCDLCFLKGKGHIMRLMRGNPELGEWWAETEEAFGSTFRKDRPSYRTMLQMVQDQPEFDFCELEDDSIQDCRCTD